MSADSAVDVFFRITADIARKKVLARVARCQVAEDVVKVRSVECRSAALQILLVLGLGASFAIPVPSRRGHASCRCAQVHTSKSNFTQLPAGLDRLGISMPVSRLAGSLGTLLLLVMQVASRGVGQILPHRTSRDPAHQGSTLSGSSNLGLRSSFPEMRSPVYCVLLESTRPGPFWVRKRCCVQRSFSSPASSARRRALVEACRAM